MLTDAYRNELPGIRITYRTHSQLPNHQQKNFQSCLSTTTVHEFLFADDCALNFTFEVKEHKPLRWRLRHLLPGHRHRENGGYASTATGAPYVISQIGAQLRVLDNFTYQCSTLSRTAKMDDKVVRRISQTSQEFGRLQSAGWKRHSLNFNTNRICTSCRCCCMER
ncbi:hypothetical protein SprV_0401684700 [Sparganum proliferum]